MAFDWKSLVQTVAPTLSRALGGPLASTAVSVISLALLGKPDGTTTEMDAAIKAADSEVLIKIKKAEQDFILKMKEMDIEIGKINAADRDSARKLELETHDPTTKWLAIGYTVGYFLIMGAIIIGVPKVEVGLKDTFNTLLGILSAAQMGIIQYYFGSSSGSAHKSAIMADVINKK